MSDLTEEELDSIERSLGGPGLVATSKSETCRMLLELRRHRSALAADRERVRGVVEQIVREEFTGKHDDATIVNADWMEIQRTIAARAAEQLATGGAWLSEDDRSELDDLLRHISDQRSIAVCDGRSGDAEALAGWRDALSRLLGASK